MNFIQSNIISNFLNMQICKNAIVGGLFQQYFFNYPNTWIERSLMYRKCENVYMISLSCIENGKKYI